MVFSSLTFVYFFLPITLVVYYALYFLSKKNTFVANLALLAASAFFYYWSGGRSGIKLLLTLVVVNYFIGYVLRNKKSKTALIVGIVFNLAVMIKYKYPSQLLEFFNLYASGQAELLSVAYPLGMSFILFNCISYLADLYKGTITDNDTFGEEAEYRRFFDFALYILFFGKITQGPIVPYKTMASQIRKREISLAKFTAGLERFLIGLFKKVLIADILRETAIAMMNAEALDCPSAWILVIVYGFQLYFDFSGYSDMALGVSKLFGFDFKENFNFPYTAVSVSDFWRKWHISLGDWFREYVYIPLGGNRKGSVYLHLFVVFVLTGLWHGNTNIFLYWGIAHGLVVVLERTPLYAKIKEKLPPSLCKAIGWCYTMAVVFLGWTCFWIGDVASFVNFLKLLLGIGEASTSFTWQYYLRPRLWILIGISVMGIILFSRPRVQAYLRTKNEQSKIFNIVKYVVFLCLFAIAFSFMTANGFAPFLYFQF